MCVSVVKAVLSLFVWWKKSLKWDDYATHRKSTVWMISVWGSVEVQIYIKCVLTPLPCPRAGLEQDSRPSTWLVSAHHCIINSGVEETLCFLTTHNADTEVQGENSYLSLCFTAAVHRDKTGANSHRLVRCRPCSGQFVQTGDNRAN